MKLTNIQHRDLAILIFCMLIVFISLGAMEIQPWDEGLYAIRAKSIKDFGAIWDQTRYTISGLYSSTYPPMSVWLMALSMKLFGETGLAIRLVSALSSGISLILIYKIAKRLYLQDLAISAVVLLAGTMTWNYYSRQGMTDIPVISFSLMSFWAGIKIFDYDDKKKIMKWSALFALAFGCCLMTKIIVSFLPVLLIIPLFFQKGKKFSRLYMIFGIALGIILALPWHIYMMNQHGWEFTRALLIPHLYSVVERNTQHLGLIYYFNQLIISNPLIILTFILFLVALFKYKRLKEIITSAKYPQLTISILLWFFGLFIVFTIAKTKLVFYSLYMFPPAILLSLWTYDRLYLLIKSERLHWYIFSTIVIALIWSFLPGLRIQMKSIPKMEIHLQSSIFIGLIIVLISLGLILKDKTLKKFTPDIMKLSLKFIPILLILRIFVLNSFVHTGTTSGALESTKILNDFGANKFIYLYHEHSPKIDTANPQLAWYTKGWILGWQAGKSQIPFKLPGNLISYNVLKSTNNYPDILVIYHYQRLDIISKKVIAEMSNVRNVLLVTDNYAVFGIKKDVQDNNKTLL